MNYNFYSRWLNLSKLRLFTLNVISSKIPAHIFPLKSEFSAVFDERNPRVFFSLCKSAILFGSVFLTFFLLGCSHEVIDLEWNEEQGYRWASLQIDESGKTGFEKLSSSTTGITINNTLPDELIEDNRVLLNGSGVAAGDINGNGLVDLYFTQLLGPNRLYKNLGGFKFKDITEEAGVAHEGFLSTGTVFADVNGNGHLDLLVSSLDKRNSLYLNDGTGNFELQVDSGLEKSKGAMTMALADVNRNGYPDLYIVNYKQKSARDIFEFQELSRDNMVTGDSLRSPFDEYFSLLDRGELPSEPREIGTEDELYFNNGDGSFTKATDVKSRFLAEDGSEKGLLPDWGLAAKFQDLNNNGLPDLYVANDFWTPDRIWINQGDGTFRELEQLAMRNSSFSSMAVDFSDINRNGFTDLFVVEMLSTKHSMRLLQMDPEYPYPLQKGEYHNRPLYNRNSLYLNKGDNTYSEISYYSGLHASDWSWATRFMDVTLNGYEDVLVNTGFKLDLQNLDAHMEFISMINRYGEDTGNLRFELPSILVFPTLKQKNRAFRNNGDLTFSETGEEWGFHDQDISLGMAAADLNNDGTLDLVISRMDDDGVIYKNTSPASRIAVRLKGKSPNTQAVGAKIELTGGPADLQTKQIFAGGDYLSGSDPLVVFAANKDYTNHKLKIRWPDGTQSKLDSLRANRVYEIDQSSIALIDEREDIFTLKSDSESSYQLTEESANVPVFEDVSDRLNHNHHEDYYDDFRVQPLLPIKLSQLGPGLAFIDVSGNGREELFIGSGKGGAAGIFEIDDSEQLSSVTIDPLSIPAAGDQAGIVSWTANGRTHIVVGMANYEQGSAEVPSALHFQLVNGEVVQTDSLPGTLSTTGPLAAADYTGNGEIDLFVGGRFLPGQYPRNASSRLFRNENGELKQDPDNAQVFENIGMVTGAIFTDITGNGEQDLAIATEWGPVKLFINNGGVFTEMSSEFGVDQIHGRWQGIASGDLTGNGYPDLVVSNWGLNSPYQEGSSEHPHKLFYSDFNNNRQMDIVESYYDSEIGGYVPRRKFMDFEPIHDSIMLHIRSHREFSEFTIEDIFLRDHREIPHKELNTLEHTLFINNDGEGFTPSSLPAEAQFSAGFFVGIADMDNSGNEDIFMTQNFFAVSDPQRNPRLDGGMGIWLKGDGNGNFEAVSGHISGVEVYGEQRGAALGDFNQNGRVDLAVSQNSAETRLFLNRTEQQGIRIKLSGPQGNSAGIGSAIRLIYGDGSEGPVRTVHAGSGYWSQNGTTQILGLKEVPSHIQVQWFDGTVQKVEFNEGTMEYVIQYPD